MVLPLTSTGVAITNPLVLYRALVATNRITPDPSQHRLAIHLQKLYDRLKDYEPTVEYKYRLNQISKAVGPQTKEQLEDAMSTPLVQRGLWQSLLAQKEKRDSVALTRTLTSHEAAMSLDSPKGLMLYGEVGTGKSMLVDLFADCLPNRKKARWHFNTFILETFAKLEQLRRHRLSQVPPSVNGPDVDDYSLLWLARDMINTSPILFLDEFQLPDRAASKIMTNLMTSFFQLGGVLVATSNRMPEELDKAAGMTFAPPPSRMESLAWTFGLGGRGRGASRSDAMFPGQGEFAGFLEVLKARCEVWEMQGGKDYRRQDVEPQSSVQEIEHDSLWQLDEHQDLQRAPGSPVLTVTPGTAASIMNELSKSEDAADAVQPPPAEAPKNYLIRPSASASPEQVESYNTLAASLSPLVPSEWTPSTMRVYGRTVPLPRTNGSTASFTFAELCGTITFGPADYISLASAYHTLILTDVPVLTLMQKNEARRFITLLDALYEARCKLLILDAEAGPDNLFFPTKKQSPTSAEDESSVYAETFAEAYQDVTAPFRPNILASNPDFLEQQEEQQQQQSPEPDYTHSRFLPFDALEDDPPNRVRRSNPFSGSGSERGPIDPDDDLPYLKSLRERAIHPDDNATSINTARGGRGGMLDFRKSGAFTGEDEKFAFKRAQSRLWEMCGARWWARGSEGDADAQEWHRPLPASVRRWEQQQQQQQHPTTSPVSGGVSPLAARPQAAAAAGTEGIGASTTIDESKDGVLFKYSKSANPLATAQAAAEAAETITSPFRNREAGPPPKFNWTHVWGTMKWGRKAGVWGQGVDGVEERRRAKREEETEAGKKKEKGEK